MLSVQMCHSAALAHACLMPCSVRLLLVAAHVLYPAWRLLHSPCMPDGLPEACLGPMPRV